MATVVLACTSATAAVGCGDGDAPAATSPTVPPASTALESTAPATVPVDTAPPSSTPTEPWHEEDVRFTFAGDEIFGVLTLPATDDPAPAVVLVSGSGDERGIRDDSTSRLFVDHAHRLAAEGFAVLRYDPPGVGRSGGSRGLPSLDERVDETMAAIGFVASRPEVDASTVGLQGWSQGPWVMAMTAARHPTDVAFLISVVGSGQTVAQQQVYGIEAQTRDAGFGEDDVRKAVLFGRLLVDWQITTPIYRELNDAAVAELGDGPWVRMYELVYESTPVDPVGALPHVIETLDMVADEPWASALYLRELYLPQLAGIPDDVTAEQMIALRTAVEANLTIDPADFMTEVRTPILAIFGEHDINVDTSRSAPLYERYLDEAGNDDATIVVLPDVGHDIGVATPGYWDLVSEWLARFAP